MQGIIEVLVKVQLNQLEKKVPLSLHNHFKLTALSGQTGGVLRNDT